MRLFIAANGCIDDAAAWVGFERWHLAAVCINAVFYAFFFLTFEGLHPSVNSLKMTASDTMKSDIGKTIHFRKGKLQNEFDELIGVVTGVVTGEKDAYIVDVSGTTFSVRLNAIIELE